jgi:moderate conductance mechanosensitive channel
MSTNEVVNLAAQVPGTNTVTINVIAKVPGTNESTAAIISQVATNASTSVSNTPTNAWWFSQQIEKAWSNNNSHAVHIAIIIGLAFAVHLIVQFIRHVSEVVITRSREKKNPLGFVTQQPKFVTLSRLIVSTITFAVYALAIYLIIKLEFPNDSTFKTYLGSAAVVGLALSFGLQGLVQDVVTGVTIILSDVMDVGDTVDLMNGVIGRVEWVGLRFTKVINLYNQEIFVPNRNIVNVSRFPHGGIMAYADVQIPAKAEQEKVVETIQNIAKGVRAQFNAIILTDPVFGKIHTTPGNWSYLRVQFKIWPGQNAIIENIFSQQMINVMKTFDPAYSNWQVVVTYRAID